MIDDSVRFVLSECTESLWLNPDTSRQMMLRMGPISLISSDAISDQISIMGTVEASNFLYAHVFRNSSQIYVLFL